MRKPNDAWLPAEVEAMQSEIERINARTNLPDDIITSAVKLRQAEGLLKQIYQALGLSYPAIDPGHEYWLAQEPEVYQRIDEIAARPLSEATKWLMDKYGLGNG